MGIELCALMFEVRGSRLECVVIDETGTVVCIAAGVRGAEPADRSLPRGRKSASHGDAANTDFDLSPIIIIRCQIPSAVLW